MSLPPGSVRDASWIHEDDPDDSENSTQVQTVVHLMFVVSMSIGVSTRKFYETPSCETREPHPSLTPRCIATCPACARPPVKVGKCESVQTHVARPGFAGRVRLGLPIADRARNFDIERGRTTKPGVLLAADIVSIGMYRPCRKRRRHTQQDNRNGKRPYDSHQTHLLTPSC